MPLRQVDEHGEITLDPLLPAAAQTSDAMVERWNACVQIAALITGAPAHTPETDNFARVLFSGPLPLHRADGPAGTPVLQEAEDLFGDPEFNRKHLRGRGGLFRDMPNVPRPRPKALKKPNVPRKAAHMSIEEIRAQGLDDWPDPSERALEMLDGHPTTAERWYVNRPMSPGTDSTEHPPYAEKRRLRHDLIVGLALAGLPEKKKGKMTAPRGVAALLGVDHPITQKLAKGGRLSEDERDTVRQAAHDARQGESPNALFMAGGPASGKTMTLDENPELLPDDYVHVDPDAIKEHLPEFRDLRAEKDRYAASAVHLESGDIAARLADEAEALGLNSVIDGTGDSRTADFIRQLQRKHDAGYDVSVLYATTPTDEAVRRAVVRAEETGRFVPVPAVREQHAKVSRNFAFVAELPWLDNIDVFDDEGHIGTKEGGEFTDLEPERMNAFRAKEQEWDYADGE
jgi:predicted ABC-type ATPase